MSISADRWCSQCERKSTVLFVWDFVLCIAICLFIPRFSRMYYNNSAVNDRPGPAVVLVPLDHEALLVPEQRPLEGSSYGDVNWSINIFWDCTSSLRWSVVLTFNLHFTAHINSRCSHLSFLEIYWSWNHWFSCSFARWVSLDMLKSGSDYRSLSPIYVLFTPRDIRVKNRIHRHHSVWMFGPEYLVMWGVYKSNVKPPMFDI